jgi:hypothetical protein
MKKIIVLPLFLALAGCGTMADVQPDLVTTKLQVVTPDPSIYNCPSPGKLPKAADLTDVQVAKVLTTLYSNNKKCANSIQAIQKFLEEAKKIEAN